MSLTPPPSQVPAIQGDRLSHEWLIWFSSIAQKNQWSPVTFQNSWANTGTPYYDAAYHRDAFGVVRMRGRIDTGSSGTVAFTLPVGFRPTAQMDFSVDNSGSIAQVSIAANGEVTPTASGAAAASLENISFIAEA